MLFNKHCTSQSGATLIVTLMLLAAAMIISIHAFKSITLSEGIAGSTMDKQRSFHAAEAALRHGEQWLLRNHTSQKKECTEARTVNISDDLEICINRFDNSWDKALTLVLPHMHLSTDGGLHSSGDIYYFSAPQLHLSYLGDRHKKEFFYELTAKGYGGHPSTRSILQSTISLGPNHTDLGSL